MRAELAVRSDVLPHRDRPRVLGVPLAWTRRGPGADRPGDASRGAPAMSRPDVPDVADLFPGPLAARLSAWLQTGASGVALLTVHDGVVVDLEVVNAPSGSLPVIETYVAPVIDSDPRT